MISEPEDNPYGDPPGMPGAPYRQTSTHGGQVKDWMIDIGGMLAFAGIVWLALILASCLAP